MICRYCNKEFKNLRSFSSHLNKHNISLVDYYVKFENFKIPKCICGENCKLEKGLIFRKTCGNNKCISSIHSNFKHTDETKQKIREKRLKYMKEHPEDTAWRKGNALSYPEKCMKEYLDKDEFFRNYLIINEYCVFPYYIDFAFVNEKIALEIDGSQHKLENRKISDDKKDKLLIENGWKIIRIDASEIISNFENSCKTIKKFLSKKNLNIKYLKVYSNNELKNIKNEKFSRKELQKLKEISCIEKFIPKNKIEKNWKESNIKLKEILLSYKREWGYIGKIAEDFSVSHTTVKRWMKMLKIA